MERDIRIHKFKFLNIKRKGWWEKRGLPSDRRIRVGPLRGDIWLPTWKIRRNQTCQLGGIASQAEGTEVVLTEYISVDLKDLVHTYLWWQRGAGDKSKVLRERTRKGRQYRGRQLSCGRSEELLWVQGTGWAQAQLGS